MIYHYYHYLSGAQCPCEKEGPIYLTLRGLCPASNVDIIYYPKNINEKFVLIGITSTYVTFNPGTEKWEMTVSSKKEKTTGSSRNSFQSFLLGKYGQAQSQLQLKSHR